MTKLGTSTLDVSPLCLGGNVFGWTADEAQSFAVLDAFAEAGGNFIDTADVYSAWISGHSGGESETILGRWMKARKNRSSIVLATKVGKLSTLSGLAPKTIRAAIEGSLRRLATDYVDLYYAHADDPETPLADTLSAFDVLVREGKVRFIAASNYTAPRLAEALATSKRESLASFVALQPHYNLVHRDEYEGKLAALCEKEKIAVLPYFALASGYLTGKFNSGAKADSGRGGIGDAHGDKGRRVLAALAEIAKEHDASMAAVAIEWLRTRPGVEAPIASARTPAQLRDIVQTVSLDPSDVARLDAASA